MERNTTGQLPVRTFVDDSSGIVIEFEYGQQATVPRRTMVYGQTTSPTENKDNPSFSALGVLFHPFAIKELFGIDAHELTNQRIHLDEFSKLPFTDIISAESHMPGAIQVLSAYLAKKIVAAKQPGIVPGIYKAGQATLLSKNCVIYARCQKDNWKENSFQPSASLQGIISKQPVLKQPLH